MQLSEIILGMTSADTARVTVRHTAQMTIRFANDRIRGGKDGDSLDISVVTKYGGKAGVSLQTNQVSETALRDVVQRCEALAKEQLGSVDDLVMRHVPRVQDLYVPVHLWHEATVLAMTSTRETVPKSLIAGVTRHGLHASGFLGFHARAHAVLTKDGVTAFYDETDCEVTVTARTFDGTASGWAGQAARDWSTVDVAMVPEQAAKIAAAGQGAQAIEPGRRTAILGPAAVIQLVRYFTPQLNAQATDDGQTGFAKSRLGGNKLGARVFDPRITIRSDPADPDGGYANFFSTGFRNPPMLWVEQGILRNLAYDEYYAMTKGKIYAENPYSLRITGETTTVDAMIAQCNEGIYVNRFSSVDLVDAETGMLTGVTRDGCFLIKNGRIERPVKNFRILESPFFFLNNVVALGPTARAPFGYTPPGHGEWQWWMTEWPRRPMIVPPMMVRDFNFSALAEAV